MSILEGEPTVRRHAPMRRPRIGVDLHVVDGKYQGSRTHVIELFSRVAREAPEIDFFLFSDRPEVLPELREEFSLPNVKRIRMVSHGPVRRLTIDLPTLSRRHAIDLLHTQYILPLVLPCAGMVTIHDILFETHPEYFDPFFRVRSKVLMRHSARRAAHVFTVSEYSKASIVERYRVPEGRISVIYNAFDPSRFFPGSAGADLVRSRGLTPGEYILTVGRIEPRKNYLTLLRAHRMLGSNAPTLVIVGQRDFGYQAFLNELYACQKQGRVLLLEDVSDDELPALYRHARVFAYPAFAEGFGIPPLEAMASGVPVITSDATSLPEVVGNAGLCVPASDPRSLANALSQVAFDNDIRARICNRATTQISRFKWENSARVVANAYERFAFIALDAECAQDRRQ